MSKFAYINLLLPLLLTLGCEGSDPAGFSAKGGKDAGRASEDGTKQDRPGNADAGSPDSGGSDAPESLNSLNGGRDSGDNEGGGGEGSDAGGTSGGGSSGGHNDSGGSGDAGGNSGGHADGDEDLGADGAGLTEDEGEIVAKTQGVPVVKVGVNFEDLGFNPDQVDKDYNDAVLCFEGRFKVKGSSVVSIRNQTVVGTTSSISGCRHKVKVEIVHADGSKEDPIEFDSRLQSDVSMRFKVGSILEVSMTPYENTICTLGVERDMHQPEHAKVLPNVCNTTGN